MKKSLAERHEVVSATYLDDNTKVSKSGWKVRIETPEDLQATWLRRHEGKKIEDARDNYDARAVMYKTKFSGVIQGDFGRSTEFGEPVLTLIWQRMPIAATSACSRPSSAMESVFPWGCSRRSSTALRSTI